MAVSGLWPLVRGTVIPSRMLFSLLDECVGTDSSRLNFYAYVLSCHDAGPHGRGWKYLAAVHGVAILTSLWFMLLC